MSSISSSSSSLEESANGIISYIILYSIYLVASSSYKWSQSHNVFSSQGDSSGERLWYVDYDWLMFLQY